MISFSLYTHIYRPLKQVFSFVATPENDFQWQYGTLASAQISRGEMAIGTLFRTVGHFMGRRIETVYEVTEFEPNNRYGFKALSGPLDSHTLYTFEMTASSTKIIISTETDPKGLFESDGSVAEKKFKKQYKENLAILKSVLEEHRLVSA
ncbi:MAG TPA: SRPBCC family protein [Anaerolineales bacterium]|nr:SRPBCC family protein [Anaerolineales bacterium]